MASRIEIIRASNSDGPAPLSACLSAAIAPVATSISAATMIPLNIVHPDDGSRRAAGERFEVSNKTEGPSALVAWAEIGRESCRQSVCQYGEIWVVEVTVKLKNQLYMHQRIDNKATIHA